MAVGIGDWTATRELNGIDADARDLGLEANIAELATYGFTTLPSLLDSAGDGWRIRQLFALAPRMLAPARKVDGSALPPNVAAPFAAAPSAGLTDLVQRP